VGRILSHRFYPLWDLRRLLIVCSFAYDSSCSIPGSLDLSLTCFAFFACSDVRVDLYAYMLLAPCANVLMLKSYTFVPKPRFPSGESR
jgi:hypothetical protein